MLRAEVRAGARGLRWHWGGGALAPGGVTAGEGTTCHCFGKTPVLLSGGWALQVPEAISWERREEGRPLKAP